MFLSCVDWLFILVSSTGGLQRGHLVPERRQTEGLREEVTIWLQVGREYYGMCVRKSIWSGLDKTMACKHVYSPKAAPGPLSTFWGKR